MNEYLLPLTGRHTVAKDTMAFRFGTHGTDFSFRAGQYADFTLLDPAETDAKGNTRTFSIASAPGKNGFLIATRMRPSAFKNALAALPLGAHVRVSGPSGSLTLPEDASKPAVFITGGIGVTLARGLVEHATRAGLPHVILHFHSDRMPASMAFFEDFEAWARENPRFHFIPTLTGAHEEWRRERGRISEAMLKRYISDLGKPMYYLAGAPAMVADMAALLVRGGADGDNIRTEEYAGY